MLCKLIYFIYENTNFYIRSGIHLVESFKSSIGLPQGCSLSPVLFCLFVADLPNYLLHKGVLCGSIFIKYLQFADDLALIAESADELQKAINCLERYCKSNCLNINVEKTKVLVFHKGRKPSHTFYLGDKEIEQVNSFVYLGFTFTTQLSFTQHLENLNAKASSKCGILLSKLPNLDIPLHLYLDLFNCYVLPTYRYGLSLYMGRTSESALTAMDSVFTKYLKRYLGVSYRANNAITHFVTNTEPLSSILKNLYSQAFTSLSFPSSLSGLQLSQAVDHTPQYDPIPLVPSYFWRSQYPGHLPTYSHSRRTLCTDIFDLNHHQYCTNVSFHINPDPTCCCIDCGGSMSHYHWYFCKDN